MKVYAFPSEELICEVPSLTDYLLTYEEKNIPYQLQVLHKSSTLLPNAKRLIYIPSLESLAITHPSKATSMVLEWSDLEENCLYVIDDERPLKLRITNPKARLLYITYRLHAM